MLNVLYLSLFFSPHLDRRLGSGGIVQNFGSFWKLKHSRCEIGWLPVLQPSELFSLPSFVAEGFLDRLSGFR